MRAALILVVLMAWVGCILGAIGFTAYLSILAGFGLGRRRLGIERRPARPLRGVVIAIGLFAVVMAACAAFQGGVLPGMRSTGSMGDALSWAALPLWAASSAAATAVVLGRRRLAR